MKQTLLRCALYVAMALGTQAVYAQVKVGNNPTSLNASAVLEVESTTKGMLPPRMTTAQRTAIASPAKGLMVFNTDLNCTETNIGTPTTPNWACMSTVGVRRIGVYGDAFLNPNSPSPPGMKFINMQSGTTGTGLSYTPSTGEVLVTEPGEYLLSAYVTGANWVNDNNQISLNDHCLFIYIVPGATPTATPQQLAFVCARSARATTTSSYVNMVTLNAGDKLTMAITTSSDGAVLPLPSTVRYALAFTLSSLSR